MPLHYPASKDPEAKCSEISEIPDCALRACRKPQTLHPKATQGFKPRNPKFKPKLSPWAPQP